MSYQIIITHRQMITNILPNKYYTKTDNMLKKCPSKQLYTKVNSTDI